MTKLSSQWPLEIQSLAQISIGGGGALQTTIASSNRFYLMNFGARDRQRRILINSLAHIQTAQLGHSSLAYPAAAI